MPDDEPSDRDWMLIGNDMRTVLNDLYGLLGIEPLPLLTAPCGKPSDDELDAWDHVLPGAKERIIAMAYKQMRHRQDMESRWPRDAARRLLRR